MGAHEMRDATPKGAKNAFPVTRSYDLRRAAARAAIPAADLTGRRAAVAAVLSPGTSEADLLFILRATRPRDPWSGHVAFPGGRMEPGDPDAFHAALRETREELGLDLSLATPLGPLDDLVVPPGLSDLVVHPWLFWMDELPELTLQQGEVAGVVRVPLDRLLDGTGRGTFELEWKGERRTMSCVALEFAGGQTARLWGMTLRIVDELLDRIDGRGIGLDRPSRTG
jgi:8-oxo-dGTP pyrophosphatase MutT (NUDIX family)